MNREQRRAAEQGKEAVDETTAEHHERTLDEHGTPQDVKSVRAKNQRHGKVTADKWNQ